METNLQPKLDMATPSAGEREFVRSPNAVKWTRADCEKLEAVGILTRRYELVEGDIIYKMPQKTAHRNCVNRAADWLNGIFGVDLVQTQAAIDVSPEDNPTSAPEPDALLLHRPRTDSDPDNPTPNEIALCIEVGNSTMSYDLSVKAGLYARAGIVEYWVVGIPNRTVTVHRDSADGKYATITMHRDGDTVTLASDARASVAVSELLPPMN